MCLFGTKQLQDRAGQKIPANITLKAMMRHLFLSSDIVKTDKNLTYRFHMEFWNSTLSILQHAPPWDIAQEDVEVLQTWSL